MTSDKGRDTPAAEHPAVLTVEEWASKMRISRGAAYAAVKNKEVKFIRIGRTIRIPNPSASAAAR